MKRHIHTGAGNKRAYSGLADYLDRMAKRGSPSGHHKRWRILQKLACDPGQEKS